MGVTWPCDGYGTQTARGFQVSAELIIKAKFKPILGSNMKGFENCD